MTTGKAENLRRVQGTNGEVEYLDVGEVAAQAAQDVRRLANLLGAEPRAEQALGLLVALSNELNAEPEECGAVYVTNTLGGMDVCVRPTGHKGGHDWRRPAAVQA